MGVGKLKEAHVNTLPIQFSNPKGRENAWRACETCVVFLVCAFYPVCLGVLWSVRGREGQGTTRRFCLLARLMAMALCSAQATWPMDCIR